MLSVSRVAGDGALRDGLVTTNSPGEGALRAKIGHLSGGRYGSLDQGMGCMGPIILFIGIWVMSCLCVVNEYDAP